MLMKIQARGSKYSEFHSNFALAYSVIQKCMWVSKCVIVYVAVRAFVLMVSQNFLHLYFANLFCDTITKCMIVYVQAYSHFFVLQIGKCMIAYVAGYSLVLMVNLKFMHFFFCIFWRQNELCILHVSTRMIVYVAMR